jgi:tRNA G18 (ribose-2'-O)-methylase SpoU
VLGDESKGVDEKIENLADEFIKINISKDIESLNVATATAIILNSIYNK